MAGCPTGSMQGECCAVLAIAWQDVPHAARRVSTMQCLAIAWQYVPHAPYRVSAVQCLGTAWWDVSHPPRRVSAVQCLVIGFTPCFISTAVSLSLLLWVLRRSLKWHPRVLLCSKAFGQNQWNAMLSDLFHLRHKSWRIDFSWWQGMDYLFCFIWHWGSGCWKTVTDRPHGKLISTEKKNQQCLIYLNFKWSHNCFLLRLLWLLTALHQH